MRLPLALPFLCCALTAAADPQKISYARVFPNGGQIGLFIAAADGSDEPSLLGNRELDYDAVWSPDRTTLVFTSEREGSSDPFCVKPDGTGLERLADDPAYDDQAAFSPDGRQLVFVRSHNGGLAPRWTLDLATRRTQALTAGTPGGDFRPAWSPDGEQIAFTSSRMGFKDEITYTDSPQPYGEIFAMRLDGTNVQQLTDNQREDGTPAWQPPGVAKTKP